MHVWKYSYARIYVVSGLDYFFLDVEYTRTHTHTHTHTHTMLTLIDCQHQCDPPTTSTSKYSCSLKTRYIYVAKFFVLLGTSYIKLTMFSLCRQCSFSSGRQRGHSDWRVQGYIQAVQIRAARSTQRSHSNVRVCSPSQHSLQEDNLWRRARGVAVV